MKKTKNPDIPKCCMCHEELGKCDINKIVGVCLNPACPNYSLLCLPEETIENFKKGTK